MLPLFEAILACNPTRVRALVEAGADVSEVDSDETALTYAVRLNRGACLDVLLSVSPPPSPSLLFLASSMGHVDCVRVLLRAGVDVDFHTPKSDGAKSALQVAIVGDQAACASALIDGGASLRDRVFSRPGSLSLLGLAVDNNSFASFCVLLLKGAHVFDVNKKFDNDVTLVHLAAANNSIEMLSALADAGATFDNALRSDGCSPLDVARAHGANEAADWLLAKS